MRGNLINTEKGQMGNKRGNPKWFQWYKGMPCLNPSGRPKGSYNIYPPLRWHRFVWGLMEPPYTGAAAARKAGYSPKSAKFIASRLRKKNVIRAMLRSYRERINTTRKISEGVYLIPDYSGKYHIYRHKKYR